VTSRDEVARAIAFFEATEDIELLRRILGQVAPRAAREVRRLLQRRGEAGIPEPALIAPSAQVADQAEAIRTLDLTTDFALLQAMSMAIGKRIEELRRTA
jgi:hypothetical protein